MEKKFEFGRREGGVDIDGVDGVLSPRGGGDTGSMTGCMTDDHASPCVARCVTRRKSSLIRRNACHPYYLIFPDSASGLRSAIAPAMTSLLAQALESQDAHFSHIPIMSV